MPELTSEQRAAVEARGKVIVSASAGSGKTFVMIEKLVRAIEKGADLDDILAVTFTKKAAAQMKEKLRNSIISRIESAEGAQKAHLKAQLSKVAGANISTIHSQCARLLRTHFYALDIDGGFEIISDDDATARDLKARAIDGLFERLYDQENSKFLHLLSCYTRKRSDNFLKKLLLESYSKVRTVARYESLLIDSENLYTEAGFQGICGGLSQIFREKYLALKKSVEEFAVTFPPVKAAETYKKIFAEMAVALQTSADGGLFAPQPPLSVTAKPRDGEGEKEVGESYKAFREEISKKYKSIRGDIADEETERKNFFKSGETAIALCDLILQFDREYAAVKRDENKLDYNDLEHLTLKLLDDKELRREINLAYKMVFVDEYQDVNPVQEEIISALGDEVFLVGDVKQAIYGFRGSRSLFFAQKYDRFEGGGGTALKLTDNFRSSAEILDFVNKLFSQVMRERTCGIDYAKNYMTAGAPYPQGSGAAQIHIFGKEEKVDRERGIYSVLGDSRELPHTREGLAVLQIVERELKSQHYDLKMGALIDNRPSDICILTRKNKGSSVDGIIRAIRDAGYPVTGAQEGNICNLPEVKKMLDILSLIDNAEQDVPLVTALLSPLGGFSEDELAQIRIAYKNSKEKLAFRDCCRRFAAEGRGDIPKKLNAFFGLLTQFRDLAEIMTADELIDKILSTNGFEASLSAGSGEKLKNILKLSAEAHLPLAAFLERVKSGGFDISAPAAAPADSIKIMTMHAAKGLEFPVVILADVCRTFKGQDYAEVPFDEEYGFAPKCHDSENMLVYPTLLRKLVKLRKDREELKNELNLFYVACTRAMCRLHVMAEETVDYSEEDVLDAKCYAKTFDMSKFDLNKLNDCEEIDAPSEEETLISAVDENIVKDIEMRFERPYSHTNSIDLPVKSSASAILRQHMVDEPYVAERVLFPDDETGAERGTAYHKFLELADFSIKDLDGIGGEIDNFVKSGRMTEEQRKLLSAAELVEILSMPVFDGLEGAQLYREQEFLCRLPAREILKTDAEDGVLVQGAIDLLARGDFGVRIIDYKYSKKSDEQLIKTYTPQLELYKKAVSIILGVRESEIGAAIINIHGRRLITLS